MDSTEKGDPVMTTIQYPYPVPQPNGCGCACPKAQHTFGVDFDVPRRPTEVDYIVECAWCSCFFELILPRTDEARAEMHALYTCSDEGGCADPDHGMFAVSEEDAADPDQRIRNYNELREQGRR